MKLHRFSPIASEAELVTALQYLHETCHKICYEATGKYLPVRGNISVFCHGYEEYAYLVSLREKLAHATPNYNGKYFPLKKPLHFPEKNGVPAATYTYIYIRQVDPYRSQVGDIDFMMSSEVFEPYKNALETSEFRSGARVFGRPEENMVELWLPNYDVISYVATNTMMEQVMGARADIAGVVVRDAEGRYLMVQEKRPDVYGKWNLPAGRIDHGEDASQAAVREAREETGYDVKLVDHVPLVSEYDATAGRSFYLFAATTVGGKLRVDPSEVLDVRWCTYAEICQFRANDELRAEVMFRAIENAENAENAAIKS